MSISKPLGEILVENGYLERNQLDELLVAQADNPTVPLGQLCIAKGLLTVDQLNRVLVAYRKRIPLGEMLVHSGLVTEAQLGQALEAQQGSGERIGDLLVRWGVIDEVTLCQFLARQYNYPMLELDGVKPSARLRALLNPVYAAQHEIVPVAFEGKDLVVALADPNKSQRLDEVAGVTGYRIRPGLATRSSIARFYERLYGQQQSDSRDARATRQRAQGGPAEEVDSSSYDELAPVSLNPEATKKPAPGSGATQSGSDLWGELETGAANGHEDDFLEEGEGIEVLETDSTGESRDIERSSKDSPVVETIVQTVISRALGLGSSDIHIEKTVNGASLRFRIDGVLHRFKLGTLEEAFQRSYRSVVARLKVMCEMDITEKRRPQDASFRMLIRREGKLGNVDFRVSTVPGRFGEAMVIRILDHKKAPKSLESLGLSQGVCDKFRGLIERPTGIILVTGPTGSGKSSTLYAALRSLYDPKIKILTAEDPIEYTHPGICQTEVKTDIGNTFAAYLRSFLRQDPDIIMVGEIRDAETAEMAVRAAQTGHLLLSTLHSINSTSSVRRLRDLEIDPNSVASTLSGVMAQRLIRKVCRSCSEPYNPDPFIMKEWFAEPPDISWRHGRGCGACNNTGFSGRTPINELWIPSAEEGILINKEVGPDDLRRSALEHTLCLAEDALIKAMRGITTLEEALRVVPYPDVVHVRNVGPGRSLSEVEKVRAPAAA